MVASKKKVIETNQLPRKIKIEVKISVLSFIIFSLAQNATILLDVKAETQQIS